MFPPKSRLFAASLFLLLFTVGSFAYSFDDDIPELNEKVARLTYVRGNVQIRRAETEEWERAVTNLPIIEGDEIVSDKDGRFEIQFSIYKYLRGDEQTAIRILTLKDEGIAVSVPQGNINIKLTQFDAAVEFFEVDAPKSTIALQAAGSYRIDAGQIGESVVRISVFDEGEARIYSSTSGFTLRARRTARVFTDGQYDGEWELADSSGYEDSFDRWANDRDDDIAKKMRDSYYDRYYDRDITGADELNAYGDWIYTRDYGYIWRPWGSAVSSYSDWSPYRYGEWRWIPPFGWTWVNDEPWGWATYHYGRWIWYNGFWHWSPYGYDRLGRSWWRPAMVIFRNYGDTYCWYPLPYYSPYYNYNYHYYSGHWRRRYNHNGGGQNPTPTPTPSVTPPVSTPILTPEQRRARITTPPLQNIPPTGVVTATKDEFGRGRGTFGRPPLATAKEVLSKVPTDGETPPILPTYSEAKKTMSPTITVQKPVFGGPLTKGRTGATPRTDDAPLDNRLKTTRILGNRPPLQINTGQGDVRVKPTDAEKPKTGAVERPINRTPPLIVPRTDVPKEPPAETKPRPVPVVPQQPKRDPVNPTPTPKPRDETPRYEPPRRVEPPMRREVPRYEPPPKREEPRPSPPPQKSDPPPQKSEPSKPAPAPPLEKKGKDGR